MLGTIRSFLFNSLYWSLLFLVCRFTILETTAQNWYNRLICTFLDWVLNKMSIVHFNIFERSWKPLYITHTHTQSSLFFLNWIELTVWMIKKMIWRWKFPVNFWVSIEIRRNCHKIDFDCYFRFTHCLLTLFVYSEKSE